MEGVRGVWSVTMICHLVEIWFLDKGLLTLVWMFRTILIIYYPISWFLFDIDPGGFWAQGSIFQIVYVSGRRVIHDFWKKLGLCFYSSFVKELFEPVYMESTRVIRLVDSQRVKIPKDSRTPHMVAGVWTMHVMDI